MPTSRIGLPGRSAGRRGKALGGGWRPALAVLLLVRQHVAVSPKCGAGDKHGDSAGTLPAQVLVEDGLRRRCVRSTGGRDFHERTVDNDRNGST